ncbi:elastin-like [Acanthochromis polyacanthus]|uniref:elastin-like n=1 Tax=Acanthochromis polyacanthus TaxID=80966 RepID=UPI00223408C5|nr:elastin-like [Acanthochromis polyacanthus]
MVLYLKKSFLFSFLHFKMQVTPTLLCNFNNHKTVYFIIINATNPNRYLNSLCFFILFCTPCSCDGCLKTGVAGGIIQPSAGTSVGGAGVPAPSGVGPTGQGQPVAPGVQQPGGVGVGTGVKPPKPYLPGAGVGVVPGGAGYPYGGTYGVPYGAGTGPGAGTGVGTLPGAKPLKPPVAGGAGIPLATGGFQGGLTYPSAGGLGGAGGGVKPPKPGVPGYGNLGGGGGYQPGAVPVVPGYRGGFPQQYYPGGYVPAPLTPQQAKAAKYGPLQGFLGGAGGGGGFRGGVAGCQGKYCGRRK